MNRAEVVTEPDKFYSGVVFNFSGWNSSTPAGLIKRAEIIIEMLNGWPDTTPATLGRNNTAQHTVRAAPRNIRMSLVVQITIWSPSD